MTVTNVMGCGTQKGHSKMYRGVAIEELSLPYRIAANLATAQVINYAHEKGIAVQYWTINSDGKIFLYDIEDVVKVRTGERGVDALQGEDDLAND